ncbi:MAG TPA: hypothetical protein PKV97_10465 [Thauera aminoaromatica]|nr:hypothetical protein [Thauera aminoaromatica]HON29424.1 hypothetical protein [Ottowia sp.]
MAATDVAICSNALLMLGAQPINDLTENNDRARLASNLYPAVRDALLRSFPWNCCIQRVVLAPDATAPAFDWTYQFQLPGDFVKALAVGELGAEHEFRIEGRKLLSNDNPCLLRYVFRNTNPATWDDGLVNVLTLQMAAAMAYGITQSAALQDALQKTAMNAMRAAKAVDGQDDTPETFGDLRLLRSRFARSDILSQ